MARRVSKRGCFVTDYCATMAAMKKAKAHAEKPEEFKRFEDFTRRLMAVPKKEIDQQKAKYEKHKATKKRRAA